MKDKLQIGDHLVNGKGVISNWVVVAITEEGVEIGNPDLKIPGTLRTWEALKASGTRFARIIK